MDGLVEQIPYRMALGKYNPSIVISSWMLYGQDWPYDFRGHPRVSEYILIGDRFRCGKQWDTWGMYPDNKPKNKEVAPFEREGFKMYELGDLKALQLCCSDNSPLNLSVSTTVSFRREMQTANLGILSRLRAFVPV